MVVLEISWRAVVVIPGHDRGSMALHHIWQAAGADWVPPLVSPALRAPPFTSPRHPIVPSSRESRWRTGLIQRHADLRGIQKEMGPRFREDDGALPP